MEGGMTIYFLADGTMLGRESYRPLGPAILPDTELRIEHEGNLWQNRRGWIAQGQIYEGQGPNAAPDAIALRPDGTEIAVTLLDRAVADAARVSYPVRGIFCYGTLMRGEARFYFLSEGGLDRIVPAEMPGTLYHLGSYPGMTLDARGARVKGELAYPSDLENRLVCLDAVENFFGIGHPGNLYRRVVVPVDAGGGLVERAWIYLWTGDPTGHPVISSGDWRARS
jgi:gamma-glutamylcyclotransferase (GGCT)/AIG2-like uncharacterized protein YtfP